MGGYGLLVTFYLAGALSVPRRFAVYPPEVAQGAGLATISLFFVVLLLCGALLYIWEAGRRCLRALST